MPCTPSEGVCMLSCHSGGPVNMWCFELGFRKAIVVPENRIFEACQMGEGNEGGS